MAEAIPTPEGDPAEASQAAAQAKRPRRSLFGTAFRAVRGVGRDLLALTTRRSEPEKESDEEAPADSAAAQAAESAANAERGRRRVGVLHSMAEQLRGAADSYLAAKIDEIEARVDQKLDTIETRIDRKIADLTRQLADMRDQELRHRLRLLKITLAFTALVAVLSLLYKWLAKFWQLS